LILIVTIVDIEVKKDCIERFIEATRFNHMNSVREPGNLRFDFLQDRNDPCHFFLYEAYESEEEVEKHKSTEHYLRWKEKVESFMNRPRFGTPTEVIEPARLDEWSRWVEP